MKIYFACSIRSGRDDQPIYAKIVEYIKEHADVLSEVFIDPNLTPWGYKEATEDKIWQMDMKWLKEADGMIAEVTTPSLGVGYEIAKAEEQGKPILALYRPQQDRSLSAMIAGSPKVQVAEYQRAEETRGIIAAWFLSNKQKNSHVSGKMNRSKES